MPDICNLFSQSNHHRKSLIAQNCGATLDGEKCPIRCVFFCVCLTFCCLLLIRLFFFVYRESTAVKRRTQVQNAKNIHWQVRKRKEALFEYFLYFGIWLVDLWPVIRVPLFLPIDFLPLLRRNSVCFCLVLLFCTITLVYRLKSAHRHSYAHERTPQLFFQSVSLVTWNRIGESSRKLCSERDEATDQITTERLRKKLV